jgi:glucose-6-phosphate-specific signal transduction histidine kinase
MLAEVMRALPREHAEKQAIMAVYAGTATAFLSLGLAIELPQSFLPIALAAELLALSWINTKVNVRALRALVALLGVLFGVALLPDLSRLVFDTKIIITLLGVVAGKIESVLLAASPILYLGLPALMLGGASTFFAPRAR